MLPPTLSHEDTEAVNQNASTVDPSQYDAFYVKVYIAIDSDFPENEMHESFEDAVSEVDSLELMQPENRYVIVGIKDGVHAEL
jgi:hypothetical protein